MAETIENRLNRLISLGIPIFSGENLNEIGFKLDEAETLLGYFSNRGFESVRGVTSSENSNRSSWIAATKLGKKLGLKEFKRGDDDPDLEIHIIQDTQYDKTYYFLLPHRKYL